MQKEDMIYDIVKRTEDKIDKHINDKEIHGKGLTAKEWGIIGGIITTVCTTVTAIVTMLIKG